MIGIAALTVACAAWLSVGGVSSLERRIGRQLLTAGPEGTTRRVPGPTDLVENVLARTFLCVASGAAVGLAFAGMPAALAGAVLGALSSWLIARLEPPSARRRREAMERDLPLAVDLLAACALAGRPVEASMDVVATAVGGPLSEVVAERSARVRLGADPLAEWRSMTAHPQVAPLARAVLRSMESGAPIADTLERLAADARRERATALQRRARSVGVRAAAPLGICFLPAFMLVGVVPTVVGGFTHLVL